MRTRAAVMRAVGGPLSVEEIELDPPKAGEVLLRMVAAGICGSDRHVLEGRYPSPVPAVAGHEGAGVVEAIGPGVTRVAVGDHVVQTFIGPCGACDACRRGQRTFCRHARPADGTLLDGTFRMHALDGSDIATTLRLGTFSAHTVTPEDNVVAIPKDVDLIPAALVSCGVATGVGAAVNVAAIRTGDTVAVLGIGGVGAAALLGARLAGAGVTIAVDLGTGKRDAALDAGATHFVDAGSEDVLAAVHAATAGRGVDKVLLTMDHVRPETYPLAVACAAPGGTVVQVGTSDVDHIPVNPNELLRRQISLTGTVFGGMDPTSEALRWIELHRAGRLPVERFVTRTYALDDINQAFADLAAGSNVRGVVVF
jgi:S-(hydroxymethyl)glutathione dehydrogenase/alcohol dehydrogenase